MIKWIDYGKTFSNFIMDGLNKPGTQIVVLIGDKEEMFLIGDVNQLGGHCDDCCDISRGDIVSKYRVLVEIENNEAN